MTEAELRAIEARANAATKGPWRAIGPIEHPDEEGHVRNYSVEGPKFFEVDHGPISPAQCKRDMDFIAHARKDVPDLLAEVRMLRKELAEYLWCMEHPLSAEPVDIRRRRVRKIFYPNE